MKTDGDDGMSDLAEANARLRKLIHGYVDRFFNLLFGEDDLEYEGIDPPKKMDIDVRLSIKARRR